MVWKGKLHFTTEPVQTNCKVWFPWIILRWNLLAFYPGAKESFKNSQEEPLVVNDQNSNTSENVYRAHTTGPWAGCKKTYQVKVFGRHKIPLKAKFMDHLTN